MNCIEDDPMEMTDKILSLIQADRAIAILIPYILIDTRKSIFLNQDLLKIPPPPRGSQLRQRLRPLNPFKLMPLPRGGDFRTVLRTAAAF